MNCTMCVGFEAASFMLNEPGLVYCQQSRPGQDVYYDKKDDTFAWAKGLQTAMSFSAQQLHAYDWQHTGYMNTKGEFFDTRCVKPGTKTYHKDEKGDVVYE